MSKSSSELAELIKEESKICRSAILSMTTLSQSSHPGGSMSSIDILLGLYKVMNVDSENPNKADRDILIVSNGHISPGVYSTLGINGFFNLDDAISEFRLAESIFEGHIEPDVPGVEWASGNLGQGLSAGCGFALAGRMKGLNNQVYVLMGDGEQQKGQISEARRFAHKYKLNNLTCIIDYNRLQINGDINQVMPQFITENFKSDGWEVIEIDGHNPIEILEALSRAKEIDSPVMILANTVMGKGVSFMENKEKYHGSTLGKDECLKGLQEIGINFDFEKYENLRKERTQSGYRSHYAAKAKINCDIKNTTPRVYEKSTDNRSAWGTAIAEVAIENKDSKTQIAVFDCDLMGSVKTGDFFKAVPENFFQAGIMEHHTAVCAAAMSKSDIMVYFADFGVFGIDETYNQHRLSDINECNIKVINTHVGLDVGEDGKTHQCIDYVGLMRNVYHFESIVPADPNQTDRAVRYSASKRGNVVISMGRSKLDLIKKENGEIYFDKDYKFEYGKADLLRKGSKAAMLVMGTLAPTAVKIIDRLASEGIDIELWNVSCPVKLDEEMLRSASSKKLVFTYEDHNVNTGLGSIAADKMMELGLFCKLVKFGVEDYACSGTADDVYRYCKLDAESIYRRIKEKL
jgi:transketolase